MLYFLPFFFFQGQFKLSKYKNHIVKIPELTLIPFYLCVGVREEGHLQLALPLAHGRDGRAPCSSFAFLPGGRSLLDTLPLADFRQQENRAGDFVLDGSGGGVQPLVSLCAAQVPEDTPLLCTSAAVWRLL